MEESQYTELSFAEKADIILAKGKPIGARRYYNQDIVLFLVYDFFVEAWYDDNEKDIREIKTIDKEKAITLYMKNVKPSDDII